jgi:hypothetical protein
LKIIGRGAPSIGQYRPDFIVTLNRDELAQLIGYSYSGDIVDPEVGSEVLVSKLWGQLRDLAHDRIRYRDLAEKLMEMAGHLELLEPLAPPVVEEKETP